MEQGNFHVTSDGKFGMEFIRNQELQDQIEKLI